MKRLPKLAGPDPARNETVRDGVGPIRCMAFADGYVLCRRPGCMPFVLGKQDWLRLRRATEIALPEPPR